MKRASARFFFTFLETIMPDYVLNRTYTHRSTLGHIVNFVKGMPTWVPPALEKEVTALGAEPVDGPKQDVLDPDKPALPLAPSGQERAAQVLAVFAQLEARNERGDFTGSGRPNLSILKELLGYEVIGKERDELWEEYLKAKAG
ncbi:hypothetical protein [Rhodoferax fermentans]|uniref:hypothetical protein n=1 Tax=Rhodoferax fermentans TaxID=28066 RepID=UPI00117B10F2|nr:hypothetical protein [Rhodoferax fermentans]